MDILLAGPGADAMSTRYLLPALYRVPSAQIAISGNDTQVLQTNGDSIFKLTAFQASTDLDEATDFSPNNFTVKITVLTTGRQLVNDFIPQRIIAPTQGFFIPEEFQPEFPPNTQIQFEYRNLSASSAINIDFVLRGIKIFQT